MSDELDYWAEIYFVLDQLAERGWLSGWQRVGEDLRVDWTEVGAARIHVLIELDRDLEANERAMTVLVGIAKFCQPPGDFGAKGG